MRCLLVVAATMVGCAPPAPPVPMPPNAAPQVEIPAVDEPPVAEAAPTASPAAPEAQALEEERDTKEPTALIEACDPNDCEGFGAGGLGLRRGGGTLGTLGIGGIGSNGVGRGTGSLGGRAHRGEVTRGDAATTGRLSKEIIQRIVRRHLGQVRVCYEQALVREPTREGKVTVLFVIGTEGGVTSTKVDSSDVGDPDLERCVTDVFDTMAFPKPEGGIVSVRYPLIFTPASS